MKQSAIYILTNKQHGVLYTGVTSDLLSRVHQHKSHMTPGFASKYQCTLLVYFEMHDTMEEAIFREKQLKAGSRRQKISLIESINPEWNDLYDTLVAL